MAEVTDQMKATIAAFGEAVRSQNINQIVQFYENGGLKFTEKAKQVDWPSVDVVASIVSDKFFVLLYKEMYYRHILANPKAHQALTLDQRQHAFQTYIDLFDYLLNREDSPNIELPASWVWDIIDEFVYQFQEFYQYRGNKLRSAKAEDTTALRNSAQVWNVQTVLKYLHAFRDKSEILVTLAKESESDAATAAASTSTATSTGSLFSTLTLYKSFGTFSLIGLLRVHCLLGDYYSAVKAVSGLQPANKKQQTVVASKITLSYYLGFSYLMMRRYADAIRTFNHILLWLSRFKQAYSKTYQTDDINKKNDQMYALLAILITFCPQRLDEHVNSTLRDVHGDKMTQIQKGETGLVEDLFAYACPKWVSPICEGDDLSTAIPAMHRLQTSLFINEIKQQLLLPTIRSFLKLYTTIDIVKLTSLIATDKLKLNDTALAKALLCYNHKTRGLVSGSGQPALEGKLTSYSDISFYIDNDMVHIFDAKAPRRFGEYFTRKIVKLDDIIGDLRAKEQP